MLRQTKGWMEEVSLFGQLFCAFALEARNFPPLSFRILGVRERRNKPFSWASFLECARHVMKHIRRDDGAKAYEALPGAVELTETENETYRCIA